MRWILIVMILLIVTPVALAQIPQNAIRISQISQTPDPVTPGDTVDLRFRVENLGESSGAFTYELVLQGALEFAPGESASKSIGSLDGFQTGADGATLFWRVLVRPDAVEGSSNTVRIRYYRTDRPDDGSTLIEPVVVRVQTTQGLLAIAQASTIPQDPSPGKLFTLDLVLENVGSAAVENVRIQLGTQSTPFTPEGGASERLIRRIAGSDDMMVSFPLYVDKDALLTVHPVPVSISYSDRFGAQYSIASVIGVRVYEEPSYVMNLENTNLYVGNSRGEVTVSLSNTGTAPLRFVMLTLEEREGYRVIGARSTYLGNLDSDDFETGQFRIFAESKDDIDLVFTLTYRDAYGNMKTEEVIVTNRLYDRRDAQRLGLVQGGGVNWGIVLLILLAVGGYVYYKRRKGALRSLKR